MFADAADDVPGVEVEAAGPLGLADGQAGRDYRRDEPQGRRDGEGEAVGYPEPDQPYGHFLVAGGGEEDHARYDRDVEAQRDAYPVDERLPLHEEEERRLARCRRRTTGLMLTTAMATRMNQMRLRLARDRDR